MTAVDAINAICTWPIDGRTPGKQALPCNRTDCPHCRPSMRLSEEVLSLRSEVERLRPIYKAAKAWRATTSIRFDDVGGSADALSKTADAVKATEKMLAAVVDEAIASEAVPPGKRHQ